MEPDKTLHAALSAARPRAATSAQVVAPVPAAMSTKVLLILMGTLVILPW